MINWFLMSKTSPFVFHRISPYSVAFLWCEALAKNRFRLNTEREWKACAQLLTQVFRRPATFEHALPIMFGTGLRARMGLASATRLGNPNFTVPFSIIHGDVDWVKSIDNGAAENLIKKRHELCGDDEESKKLYNYTVLPDSDHNMHFENP